MAEVAKKHGISDVTIYACRDYLCRAVRGYGRSINYLAPPHAGQQDDLPVWTMPGRYVRAPPGLGISGQTP